MFKKSLSKYKKIFHNKRLYSSISLTKDTIKKLPKADLHYHLDGSIRNSSIIELAKEDSIKLPTYNEKELRTLVVVPDNCQSLIQFLSAFDITLSVLQTKKGLERAMMEIAEDSVNDGVRYIEVRFSPVLHLKSGLSVDEVLETVCGTIPKIESKMPLTVRIIVCGMRQMDPKISKELAQAALKFKNKGVVAFDLAGPENDFPSLQHREAYDIALGGGLKSTCHAGESDGPNSIKDAIDNARVSRIGHGIALIRDKNLLEEVKKKGIVLEVCPTSNFKTKATQTFEEHPIDLLYSHGVKVTVNTDDKLMCDIDLSDEFYLLHTKKKFEIQDLLVLMDNSFKYSFLEDEKLKNRLRKDSFNKRFQILEQDGFSTKNILQFPQIKRLKEEIDSL